MSFCFARCLRGSHIPHSFFSSSRCSPDNFLYGAARASLELLQSGPLGLKTDHTQVALKRRVGTDRSAGARAESFRCSQAYYSGEDSQEVSLPG